MKKWGALLLLPVGLMFTPVANADIYDDIQFVNEVGNAGINFDSRENLIWMGHELCNALQSGNIAYDEAVSGMSTHGGGGLDQSNFVASRAVSHICPDQWYQVVTSQIPYPSPSGPRVKV